MKLIFILLFSFSAFAQKQQSIARIWNDHLLDCVRGDYARPTVTARNLYHFSVLAFDSWALYSKDQKNLYIDYKASSEKVEEARHETISYAVFNFLKDRYKNAPKWAAMSLRLRSQMTAFGYNPDLEFDAAWYDLRFENKLSPAQNGLMISKMLSDKVTYDGSRELENYVTDPLRYPLINPPLIVKLQGVQDLVDVNLWQPLALDMMIDQSGFPLPGKVSAPLTLHWGQLPPFAMTLKDRSPSKKGVYFDPGPPPAYGGERHDEYVSSMVQVIEFSSWLDPRDEKVIDISPLSLGKKMNPFTNEAYRENVVKRGDYVRVLAEFWADGPNSETPPGHWNKLANDVTDHSQFKRKWLGQGNELSPLEWDVKMYLTLNGALYDASIAAWGLKGYYQGSRPISAIRYLAEKKELPIVPGLIEEITDQDTIPGGRFFHLIGHEGELAVRSWLGSPKDPKNQFKGVGWILGTTWLPYQRPTFVTPPFPGFISGHSTFSRAAAEVMTAITGSSYFPGGLATYRAPKNEYLVFEDGPSETVELQWATYQDAADQSGISRIYGGIHGYIDDRPGRKIGAMIGKRAVAKVNELVTE